MIKVSLAVVAALSLAVVGCNKGGGGGDADCATSIGKGVDRMAAARVPSKDLPPEIKAKMDDFNGKMKDVFIKHCTADKWPAEVVKCFETISGRPEVMKCQSMLPKEQQDSVRAEIRELMVSSGIGGRHGGPGGPGGPHGDMGGSGAPAMGGSGSGAPAMGGSSSAGTLPAGSGNAPPAPPSAPAAGSAAP